MGERSKSPCRWLGWCLVLLVAAFIVIVVVLFIRKKADHSDKAAPVPGLPGAITKKYGDALKIAVQFLNIQKYTIFATHIESLSELATIYPNVKILHFYVDIKNNRLDFKFQLKDGPRHVPHYGLLLAKVAGLPSSVIKTARAITTRITEKEVKRMEVNCQQYHPIQKAYHVAQRLICLKYSSQDEDSIRQVLQDLKESYIEGRI